METLMQNRKVLFSWIASLLVALVIMMTPVTDAFTIGMHKFLAITIWFILSIALDLFPSGVFIPSILYPTLLLLTGTVPAAQAYSGWLNQVVYVFFVAFAMAAALEECGLLKRIAYWCLLKCQGSYMKMYYGTFFICLICTIITFGNSYVFLAAFIFGVIMGMGLEAGRQSAMITWSALLGTMTTRLFVWAPQKAGQISAAASTVLPGYELTVMNQLFIEAPTILFALFMLWVSPKIFLKKEERVLDVPAEVFRQKYLELGVVTKKEKLAAVLIGLVMLFILTNPIHNIGVNYAFLIIVPLFFLPGIEVGTSKTIKNVKWDQVFFAATCISIGTVGTALGVHTLISNIATPILAEMSPRMASFGVLLMSTALNFILTPTAMFAAFPAVLAEIALSLGVNPDIFLYQLMNGADMIFFAYEFIPYLIFASFGMISFKDFLKFSTFKVFTFFIFVWILLFPWWDLIGLL